MSNIFVDRISDARILPAGLLRHRRRCLQRTFLLRTVSDPLCVFDDRLLEIRVTDLADESGVLFGGVVRLPGLLVRWM